MNILKEQPTENNPITRGNYPYGFKKANIRYWVETTNRGQRFVSQTQNPTTLKWNKPKKSTYDQIILIGEKDNGHISFINKSVTYSSLEEIKSFGDKYSVHFSEYQSKEFKTMLGLIEVYDKVEYKVVSRKYRHKVTGETTEQINLMEISSYEEVNEQGEVVNAEKEQKEKREANRQINRLAVANATSKGVSVGEAISTFKRA